MKVNIYIPTVTGAQPVTAKNFVSAIRLMEAWRYLQNLQYTNIGELFEDSIANAIESSVYSNGDDVKVNTPNFYEAVEINILSDLESMFGLERGKLYDVDLSAIKWWKVVVTIPTETDVVSTSTMTVDDPIKEGQQILDDLLFEPEK